MQTGIQDKLTAIPPKVLEEARDDPVVARQIFNTMAMVTAHNLFVKVNKMDANAALQHDALRTFAKLADMEPKANQQVAAGTGFSISINIPQIGANPAKTITMESAALPAVDADNSDLTCGVDA